MKPSYEKKALGGWRERKERRDEPERKGWVFLLQQKAAVKLKEKFLKNVFKNPFQKYGEKSFQLSRHKTLENCVKLPVWIFVQFWPLLLIFFSCLLHTKP